jgi:hypothetical protein
MISPAVATSPDPAKIVIKIERSPQAAMIHAAKVLPNYGWNKTQFACLKELWRRESNWRPEAKNKQPVRAKINGVWQYVHAGGIPQILGMDPKTAVEDQIRRGLVYIESRYGTPCRALSFHDRQNWY